MNKYNNGKIYKIVDNTNDNVYYGSTVKTLEERLTTHKFYKSCRSKLIIDNGDYNIILVENYPCESKEQLELRERYYIENNKCVNKNIPGRTHAEWYQANKEHQNKKHKEYSIKYREYQKTWGGRTDHNNNSLLKIDINLFQ